MTYSLRINRIHKDGRPITDEGVADIPALNEMLYRANAYDGLVLALQRAHKWMSPLINPEDNKIVMEALNDAKVHRHPTAQSPGD